MIAVGSLTVSFCIDVLTLLIQPSMITQNSVIFFFQVLQYSSALVNHLALAASTLAHHVVSDALFKTNNETRLRPPLFSTCLSIIQRWVNTEKNYMQFESEKEELLRHSLPQHYKTHQFICIVHNTYSQ